MHQKILSLLLALLAYGLLPGQCPPLNYRFLSQADIDSFSINYPDCTDLDIGLQIGNFTGPSSDIDNLEGLRQIQTVKFGLVIVNNDSLKSLQPLENIHSILAKINIIRNASLVNLRGLERIKKINYEFKIEDNPCLQSVDGLDSLTDISGDLRIDGNASLTNLAAFGGVKRIAGNFRLASNPLLTNLTGLDSLEEILRDWYIYEIPIVNFMGMESLKSVGNHFTVIGCDELIDFTGMENLREVGGSTFQGKIFSIVYNDKLQNLNGLQLSRINSNFELRGNLALTSLTGLENVTYIGGFFKIIDNRKLQTMELMANLNYAGNQLWIRGNTLLSYCHIDAICDYISGAGFREIKDNAGDCETEMAVYIKCYNLTDEDMDGYYSDVDCDDTNAEVNPGAPEIPYNGIDDDCEENTLDDDLDGDGFPIDTDCDDTNAGVNPDATEIPDNGIDEDCNGTDLVTAIQELAEISVQLFPNPVNAPLQLQWPGFSGAYEIALRNTAGQIVAQRSGEASSVQWNLNHLPSGIYLITIQHTQFQYSTKIVIP